jgi:hypothetical protein|tara:strand:+ start:946 stop:1365 length:420 start_codon:yes stop_codon:yes gene_type:complete
MQITITKKVDVEVKTLRAVCGVRYWEDATVNGKEDADGDLMPFARGETWDIQIDLDTGKIKGWPGGTIATTHYKVCDDGIYSLLEESGETVTQKDGYVPSMLSPAGNGYGDYIIMNIGADGQIEGWEFDASYFDESDDY